MAEIQKPRAESREEVQNVVDETTRNRKRRLRYQEHRDNKTPYHTSHTTAQQNKASPRNPVIQMSMDFVPKKITNS